MQLLNDLESIMPPDRPAPAVCCRSSSIGGVQCGLAQVSLLEKPSAEMFMAHDPMD